MCIRDRHTTELKPLISNIVKKIQNGGPNKTLYAWFVVWDYRLSLSIDIGPEQDYPPSAPAVAVAADDSAIISKEHEFRTQLLALSKRNWILKVRRDGKLPYCTRSSLLTYTIPECLSARSGFARSGPIYCHPHATKLLMPQHIGILYGIGIIYRDHSRNDAYALHSYTRVSCVDDTSKYSGVMKWKSTVENSGLLGAPSPSSYKTHLRHVH